MNITEKDIRSIIQTFEESDWEELNYRSDEFEIRLSKSRSIGRMQGLRSDVSNVPGAAPDTGRPASPQATHQPVIERTSGVAEEPIEEGLSVVRAPNLGVFYRSPKPGAPPYVEVGQTVDANSEICLIEVMKLFTPVIAGMRGTVRKILVEDGALVEFDQALFLIQPSD